MADSVNPLIAKLRETRADYKEEASWHKFLLDAAYGTGGFRGKVGPTAISQLGWAAEAYAQISAVHQGLSIDGGRESYLDQFPREYEKQFQRRIDVAHYTNYVGPIHNLLLSYLNKAEFTRDGVPQRVEDWQTDADGKGTPWEPLLNDTIRPRASLLGWCPVVFDTVNGLPEEVSEARSRELGQGVRAIPLFPINVLDWIEDEDGHVTAMKTRIARVERADLLSASVRLEYYSLWYRDRVDRYVVTVLKDKPETVEQKESRPHTFGRVPIVMFRANATPDDKVRGISSIANSSVTARRLFNLESEQDDHIRGQVFAILGVPVEDLKQSIDEIVSGNGSGIKVPMTSHLPLHYVAPPASVAATIETRIEVLVREVYRTENVEHAKATGTQATSGVARAYEFEQTNRRLSGMAGCLARDEQDALRLVGTMFGDKEADKATVAAPTDFSVEDLAAEIQAMLDALGLKLGPTAELELRKRMVQRMLPNLPQDTRDQIEQELEEIRQQSEQDEALAREVQRTTAQRTLDGEDEDDKSGGDNEPAIPEAAE
jgi:hypothetical protein